MGGGGALVAAASTGSEPVAHLIGIAFADGFFACMAFFSFDLCFLDTFEGIGGIFAAVNDLFADLLGRSFASCIGDTLPLTAALIAITA
jgi:hypothetical protein